MKLIFLSISAILVIYERCVLLFDTLLGRRGAFIYHQVTGSLTRLYRERKGHNIIIHFLSRVEF